MGDDPFYTPGRVVTPRVVPRPAEPLWEFRKDHVTYACELRYHGEWGVEAQLLHDGDLRIGRRFQTRGFGEGFGIQGTRSEVWDVSAAREYDPSTERD